MLAGRLDGAGQVAGINREVLDPPLRGQHGLHNRTQPGFLAIAPQQTHGAGKVLTAGQRSLEAEVEFVRFHMGRDDVFNVPADQVAAFVEHLAEEVLIDRLNPSIRIQGQDQHLAFQTVLHLLKAGEFFAKSRQLLLQAFVEHGKHRWTGMESGMQPSHRPCGYFLKSVSGLSYKNSCGTPA